MPKEVAIASSIILLGLGLNRLRQGLNVRKYQKNLIKSPRLILKRKNIKAYKDQLYLGHGFIWTSQHTQRLHEARDRDSRKYVTKSKLFYYIRRKEIEWKNTKELKWLYKMTSTDAWYNPLRPLPPVGGDTFLHGVGVEDEVPVFLPLVQRKGHLIIQGTTGSGKTRAAELYITQDIRRKNNAVIVIDPKGDADLLLTTYREATKAGRKVYVIHLGFTKYSARYNALGSFSRVTEIASRVSSPLPGDGDSAAFKEFAWQFTNVISVAVTNLGKRVDYTTVREYIRKIDPLLCEYGEYILDSKGLAWKEHYEEMLKKTTVKSINNTVFKNRDLMAVAMFNTLNHFQVNDQIVSGLMHAFQYEKSYFDKLTNAVGPFLEKLMSGSLSEILAPDYTDINDKRPIVDWEEVLRQNAVVYVGLDALTDPEVSAAVGSAMFSDLTSLAGRKTKYGLSAGLPDIGGSDISPDVIIHGDEFSDLVGQHMVTLLNKSRSADYQLNLYTQTWADVEAKLGSKPKASQLAGNLNTTAMFRVKHPETAEMLTKQLPETQVSALMAVSQVNDGRSAEKGFGFTSSNEDRISKETVDMLTPADIVGLPIGQSFCLLSGSHPYKIRVPELSKDDSNVVLPEYITEMVAEMRRRYNPTAGWNIIENK